MTALSLLGPNGERSVSYLGTTILFRVDTDQSEGRFAAVEVRLPAGPVPGPPLHVDGHDEHFYVLDGEVTFGGDDGQRTRAAAGSSLYVPKGTVHAFSNLATAPARMLVTFSPGDHFERYFEQIAELLQGTPTMNADLMARIQAIGAPYGLQMKGGPLLPA